MARVVGRHLTIERVQNDIAPAAAEQSAMAGMSELSEHRIRQSGVVAVEPFADGFHLRIDAHGAPGGCVERAQLIQHLGEAWYRQTYRGLLRVAHKPRPHERQPAGGAAV